MLLLLASLAAAANPVVAAPCPWADAEAPTVEATMTTVRVDGVVYPVRGKRNREAFRATLQACDAGAAIVHFEKWRSHRRRVNMYIATGIPAVVVGTIAVAAFVPAGGALSAIGAVELSVGVPIYATQADKQRRLMVDEINASMSGAR